MASSLTQSISLDCIDSIGGIKKFYVGVDIAISNTTYDADNQITGITGTGTFYEYELPKDTANFVGTGTISQTNGTAFYSQAISIDLHKLSADKRNELLLLSKNRDIKCVFEDNNGNLWLTGKTRGGVVSALSSNTGTAPGDPNNYKLTITADEPDMAFQLDSLDTLTTGGFTVTTA